MITMSNKGCIYVPTTSSRERGKQVSESIARTLAEMFGGANVSERQGYYQMEDGTIVKELNYVVPVWTNNSTVIKAEMQQETVGIEYNNKFYLI